MKKAIYSIVYIISLTKAINDFSLKPFSLANTYMEYVKSSRAAVFCEIMLKRGAHDIEKMKGDYLKKHEADDFIIENTIKAVIETDTFETGSTAPLLDTIDNAVSKVSNYQVRTSQGRILAELDDEDENNYDQKESMFSRGGIDADMTRNSDGSVKAQDMDDEEDSNEANDRQNIKNDYVSDDDHETPNEYKIRQDTSVFIRCRVQSHRKIDAYYMGGVCNVKTENFSVTFKPWATTVTTTANFAIKNLRDEKMFYLLEEVFDADNNSVRFDHTKCNLFVSSSSIVAAIAMTILSVLSI